MLATRGRKTESDGQKKRNSRESTFATSSNNTADNSLTVVPVVRLNTARVALPLITLAAVTGSGHSLTDMVDK
jgi:hypothetical protein